MRKAEPGAGKDTQRKRVLLLQTGGTIAMELARGRAEATLPHPDPLPDLLDAVPELRGLADLESVHLFRLDSTDVGPRHWAAIAAAIHARYNDADGFVVLHGTDTMAFTAAALSFFLQGLGKPVVLTGSQRPLSSLRSDARVNLVDAIELATTGLPGVMLAFDNKVHRGNRATKHSNAAMEAFRSYNAPLLGRFGVSLRLSASARALLRNASKETGSADGPTLDARLEPRVLCIAPAPGASLGPAQRQAIVREQRGLVLMGFGSGNLPATEEAGWLALCRDAGAAGIPVVMTSQCRTGRVNLHAYEPGRRFAAAGVIGAADLSLEAAVVKLMVMLGRDVPAKERAAWYAAPLAGECDA